VTAFLLDVNVLIGLLWPAHESHSEIQRWFARNARQGWATCPFTQAAFVRIISNPAFSADAVTPQEAISVLNSNLAHRFHRFWKADVPFAQAVEGFRDTLVGHQQVTDAYLLGLAIHNNGKLATLDRAVLALLPPGAAERDRVEIVSQVQIDR
jgi:toxin-antitoxin system PIN domain toxin